MTLAEKVKSVEEIFQLLDTEINTFKEWSGLKCIPDCGKCCFKPDIDATVLEFLPLAYHLYKNGQALNLYDRVVAGENNPCLLIQAGNSGGMCGNYKFRGLICRLFGYSARLNKLGKADMVTCKIIKTEQSTPYKQAMVLIGLGERTIPVIGQYYMRLAAIDEELGRTLYPINTAIRKALEIVLQYYSYRDIDGV